MGKMLALGIRYPSEKVSSDLLLRYLLEDGIVGHLRPQMGITIVDGSKYEFGIYDYQRWLLEGEKFIAPGNTSLPNFPDATKGILSFLSKHKSIKRCDSELGGEVNLHYVQEGEEKQGWIFRNGFRDNLSNIEVYKIFPSTQISSLDIIAPDPCFFLKDWWPDNLPNYSSPKTAEQNWDSMVNIAFSVIEKFGDLDLEQSSLSIEGSGPIKESEWLIEHAKKLPKLVIDYA